MFLFKRKKIVVDAFTMSPPIWEYYPIQKTINFLPNWWKSLPKSYDMHCQNGVDIKVSTLKQCSGFIEYYGAGFIMPLWADLNLKITEESWAYQFSFNWSEGMDSMPEKISSHDRRQYGSSLDNFVHLKLCTPWVFKEKRGVKFYFGQPTWNVIENINRLHNLPGVVDFKYQHVTNVNIIVPDKPDVFNLSSGYPLAHMIPLSEDDIEVKNHLVSKEEYNKIFLRGSPTSFQGIYKKHKNIIKQNESKCPFGFK